jgi:methylenetetrahydrofolate reductase (NADPH)
LRGGSLPIAQAIKENFSIPCVAHFTCRDLSPPEIENQLMDHHYFGIRNILALRGDPPEGQPDWKPRPESYPFAYQLIEQIRRLNEGHYLERAGGRALASQAQEKTDFCIGAAAYPDHLNSEERIRFFRLKVEAGAHYGITDMLFDPDSYAAFLEDCAKAGVHVPVLPGTRLLKDQTQALKMKERFRVRIPDSTLARLPKECSGNSLEDLSQGLDLFHEEVEKLKSLGAPGVHLYVIGDTAGSAAALRRLQSS